MGTFGGERLRIANGNLKKNREWVKLATTWYFIDRIPERKTAQSFTSQTIFGMSQFHGINRCIFLGRVQFSPVFWLLGRTKLSQSPFTKTAKFGFEMNLCAKWKVNSSCKSTGALYTCFIQPTGWRYASTAGVWCSRALVLTNPNELQF